MAISHATTVVFVVQLLACELQYSLLQSSDDTSSINTLVSQKECRAINICGSPLVFPLNCAPSGNLHQSEISACIDVRTYTVGSMDTPARRLVGRRPSLQSDEI